VCQQIDVGSDLSCEGIVDIATESCVAIEALITLQETDTFGKELPNTLIASIDIDLVDTLSSNEALCQVAEQRLATQQAEILALDTLAIEADGDKCYGLHLTILLFVFKGRWELGSLGHSGNNRHIRSS